jgi:hypothetical protein
MGTDMRRDALMPTPGRAGRLPLAALALLAGLYAAGLRAQTPPSVEPGWSFAVTPYVWAPSIDGSLRYRPPGAQGGVAGASVGIDATNLFEALNFAAMVAAEARNGRFSILTDLIYLDLGNAESRVQSVDFVQVGRNPVSSTLNAGTETSVRGSLWTLAGGYTVAAGGWGHVDALAGFRLFSLSARIDVRLSADVSGPGPGLSFARAGRLRRDADLFDGIVGLRGRLVLGAGFHLPYALDVGAGSSRLTWQAAAGIGYQTGWAGVTLGYRHLSYDQGGDRLVQDVSFSGPFLAVNITF